MSGFLASPLPTGAAFVEGQRMYFNTSVANFSPLLLYIPQALWWEAPPNDPSLVNYATKSYHATNASQGRGSISFYWSGTGIWLYGGYQPTLGAYQIILDGQVYNYSGIRDNSSSLAGYLLHGSQGLAAGSHSIEMINVSQDPDQDILDLDYLVFESYFKDNLTTSEYNHSSTAVQYLCSTPNSEWHSHSDFRVTNAATGAIKLNFTGASIAVYGPINPSQAPFLVSVDNESPSQSLPNTQQVNVSSSLIYFNNALSSGNHTLVIQNNPMVSSNRSMLGLSYIQINSTTPASDALAPETPSQRNATIIGSTLICSVLGSTVIAVRRWLKRTRRRKAKHRALYAIRPFMDIPLPPARPTGPFSLTTPPSPRSADQVMIIDSGGPRAGHGSPSAGDSSAQLRLAPSLTYPPVATRYTPVQTASTPDFPCEATVRPSRIAPLRRRNGAIGGRSQAPVIELPPPYDHAFIRL